MNKRVIFQEGIVRSNLITHGKLKYIAKIKKGIRGCILCKIRDHCADVESVEVIRTKLFIVTCNLYPYNTGHIMIFPKRHIVDVRQMKPKEWAEYIKLQDISIEILTKLYHTDSYNIGLNIGKFSGASIRHLHFHLVPRFKSEMGAIDIFAGAKIIIENPKVTQKRLQKEYKRIIR
jgi:ATP adenylyltransferase